MINCRHKKLLGIDRGIVICGIKKVSKKNSNLEIMYFGSLKDIKQILGNSPKSGLVSIGYNSTYQITLCFWSLWISLIQTLCLLL